MGEQFKKKHISAGLLAHVGAGNTTKLANQIIVACNIQALAEALTLAQKVKFAFYLFLLSL